MVVETATVGRLVEMVGDGGCGEGGDGNGGRLSGVGEMWWRL